MSSFKTKNKVKKKLITNNRQTLDTIHNQKIDELNTKQNNLKNLQKKHTILIDSYKKLDNVELKKLTPHDIEIKLNLKEEIFKYENEINSIKNKKEDIDYFLNTGKLVFDYYKLTDNIAKGNVEKNLITPNKNNGKSVMDYFNKNINKPNKIHKTRANIYEEYMAKVEPNFIIKNNINKNIDICSKCNIEKILYISDGKLICNICGEETPILIDSDKPSYKDPPREICYFAYKRINHFNEWLAQFQAKESTDIPQDVYDSIIIELKKERIIDMSNLSSKKLREILKKLKKNKYYEHIPHIINKLNGIPPPIMSRKTEEELRRMFKEIQVPFHKFCPINRTNFLSYSYVLHKFVQLLELDEFLPCFLLLKSREKLYQQDQIWKKICGHLNWQFIPSI